MNFSKVAFALSLSMMTFAAVAEPSCVVDVNKQKLYRLELTVPSTFCQSKQAKKDPSCKNFPKPSIQLHGLWPNYSQGYPQGECGESCPLQSEAKGKYCKYPTPPGLYDSSLWQGHKDYMAGVEKCLERHEWVKHGTCSPMQPAAYFGWALDVTKSFADAIQPVANKNLSRKNFNALISDKFPDLDGAVRLNCKGKYVLSLYVAYEWGDVPGKPIKTSSASNSFGNCGNVIVFPAKT